jgi:hypothetical protein
MRWLARLCVFLALLWAAPGFAAVALDVAGTETLSASAASPHTYTGLTTGGSLTNGAVECIVIYDVHVTASAATWDSVSMTLVSSANNAGTNGRVEIWGLSPIGAHTGAKTFSVSWTGGAAQTAIACRSWTGVDQTGGATSFPNGNSTTSNGQGGTVSVVVTSAVGDAVVAGHAVDSDSYASVNNTSIFLDNGPANISAAANRAAGAAGSVTMSATLTGGNIANRVAVGVDILAATGGGPTCPMTRSLMGVGC